MPVTTNVALSVPAHGANVDTWDADPVNNNSQLLDSIFGGVSNVGVAAATTLTAAQLDVSILRFVGVNNATMSVNVSAIRKAWVIENKCTGTGVVVLTGGAGNVCAAPPGSSTMYWDGANVDYINMGRVGDYWFYPVSDYPPWVVACTVRPYIACIGGSFSQVTYPLLFQLLGTTVLPNFRGRAWYASDPTGTILTVPICGINGVAIGAAGGAANMTLARANLPNVQIPTSGQYVSGGQFVGFAAGVVPAAGALNFTPSDYLSGGAASQVAATSISPACIGGIIFIRAA